MDCLPSNTSLAYQWIKRGEKLPRKVIGIYTPHLTIPNIQVQDTGEYGCQLTNSSGFIYSKFEHLKVKGTHVRHIHVLNIIYRHHCLIFIQY